MSSDAFCEHNFAADLVPVLDAVVNWCGASLCGHARAAHGAVPERPHLDGIRDD